VLLQWKVRHLRDCLPAQELDGLVIHDNSVIPHNAVVAVTVVGVQSNVCIHLEVWEFVLELADGALRQATGIECLLSCARLEFIWRLQTYRLPQIEFLNACWLSVYGVYGRM
jgi:hypothetical protein